MLRAGRNRCSAVNDASPRSLTIAAMEARRDRARGIEAWTAPLVFDGPDGRPLEAPPQRSLVALGPDPRSGLHEFADPLFVLRLDCFQQSGFEIVEFAVVVFRFICDIDGFQVISGFDLDSVSKRPCLSACHSNTRRSPTRIPGCIAH